mmetsp:Transcript_3754/g.11906  ORF Transcript_3754/g.11906 Transcript_3754/m.11906 type:complete len:284 (-) Transcript_3754:1213-2064(-)
MRCNREQALHASYHCPPLPTDRCSFTSGSRQRPRAALNSTKSAFLNGRPAKCKPTMIAQPPENGLQGRNRLFGDGVSPSDAVPVAVGVSMLISTMFTGSTGVSLACGTREEALRRLGAGVTLTSASVGVLWRLRAAAPSPPPRPEVPARFLRGALRTCFKWAHSSGEQLLSNATSRTSVSERKTIKASRVPRRLLRKAAFSFPRSPSSPVSKAESINSRTLARRSAEDVLDGSLGEPPWLLCAASPGVSGMPAGSSRRCSFLAKCPITRFAARPSPNPFKTLM